MDVRYMLGLWMQVLHQLEKSKE